MFKINNQYGFSKSCDLCGFWQIPAFSWRWVIQCWDQFFQFFRFDNLKICNIMKMTIIWLNMKSYPFQILHFRKSLIYYSMNIQEVLVINILREELLFKMLHFQSLMFSFIKDLCSRINFTYYIFLYNQYKNYIRADDN